MGTPALDADYLREKVVVWWVFRGENIDKSISNGVFLLVSIIFYWFALYVGRVWQCLDVEG
jgi:hypothetical protein